MVFFIEESHNCELKVIISSQECVQVSQNTKIYAIITLKTLNHLYKVACIYDKAAVNR